jgi:hypothetical protein
MWTVDGPLWIEKEVPAMAHNCKYVQTGHQVCAEHMLTRDSLRYRFRKQMSDIISIEELTEWHELMTATMLPADKVIPLDDRPQSTIDFIAKGGVAQ